MVRGRGLAQWSLQGRTRVDFTREKGNCWRVLSWAKKQIFVIKIFFSMALVFLFFIFLEH